MGILEVEEWRAGRRAALLSTREPIRYAQDTRAGAFAAPVLSPSLCPSTDPGAPMSDLNDRFEAAVAQSKNLSERPDNATLLQIYALYKQATGGDNTEKKPSFSDMVGRAKWDAWAKLKGTEQDAARQQYIDLIESLS
jgi:acyl-CoA-binding protein